MIGVKFINMIKNHSGEIASKWARGILKSRYTASYKRLSEEELFARGKEVYDHLAKWLDRDLGNSEMGKLYVTLGKHRYEEGFPLCELLYALNYTKKVLWNHILSEELFDNAFEIYQALDLMVMVYKFFDSLAFYVTRGYHEALYIKISKQKGIDKEKVDEIFPPGSFYYEGGDEEGNFERVMGGFNLFKVK